MIVTILELLIVLIAACIVLGVVGRVVVNRIRSRKLRPRDAPQSWGERPVSRLRQSEVEPVAPFPIPPETTLLRMEPVAISQAGNPTPMLRTGVITGTAYWYHAALSYLEVTAWYRAQLPVGGWQEEEGHAQLRVFRRERTLLWLADGEDSSVWQRLTNPLALSPPAASSRGSEASRPSFTVLTYDTGGTSPPMGRGPFRPFGGFGGFSGSGGSGGRGRI